MDRRLVERAQRGDRDAYEALARASASRLYATAYRIVRDGDRAEDTVADRCHDRAKAVVLPDGSVLVIGGVGFGGGPLASVERYGPR